MNEHIAKGRVAIRRVAVMCVVVALALASLAAGRGEKPNINTYRHQFYEPYIDILSKRKVGKVFYFIFVEILLKKAIELCLYSFFDTEIYCLQGLAKISDSGYITVSFRL